MPYSASQGGGERARSIRKCARFGVVDVAHFLSQCSVAAFLAARALTLISAFHSYITGYGAQHGHLASAGQLPQYGSMQGSAHQSLPGYQQQPYGQQQQPYGQQQSYGAPRGGIGGGSGPGFGGSGGNASFGAPRGPPGSFAPHRPVVQYPGSASHLGTQYGAQSNSGWR